METAVSALWLKGLFDVSGFGGLVFKCLVVEAVGLKGLSVQGL